MQRFAVANPIPVPAAAVTSTPLPSRSACPSTYGGCGHPEPGADSAPTAMSTRLATNASWSSAGSRTVFERAGPHRQGLGHQREQDRDPLVAHGRGQGVELALDVQQHLLRAGGAAGDVDVPEVEEPDELLDDAQVLPPVRRGELVRERDHERFHQRPQIVELARCGQLRQQLGPLVLDRAVVPLGDRDQQPVAATEVVVERRRVALSRGLDDALQRNLVDAVAGEHLLRGAQQRLPRVGRVTSHNAASVDGAQIIEFDSGESADYA